MQYKKWMSIENKRVLAITLARGGFKRSKKEKFKENCR